MIPDPLMICTDQWSRVKQEGDVVVLRLRTCVATLIQYSHIMPVSRRLWRSIVAQARAAGVPSEAIIDEDQRSLYDDTPPRSPIATPPPLTRVFVSSLATTAVIWLG